ASSLPGPEGLVRPPAQASCPPPTGGAGARGGRSRPGPSSAHRCSSAERKTARRRLLHIARNPRDVHIRPFPHARMVGTSDRGAMNVEDAVRAHGGVVPSATLVRAGMKAHLIESAVATGRLKRVRRRWVAVPDADRLLVWAATAGVVLSCMTQARRLGLWTLDQGIGFHVAARAHAGRVGRWKDTTVHWAEPLIQ